MNPPLPVTRTECVLYRVSPCTLLEGVVVVLNDTWHNSSNKQQNQQQTERRAANMGPENLHRHMSNDSYNYAAYNASAVVVVIVAFIVWFIVYTLWSVSYFLIAEISWSRDLLRFRLGTASSCGCLFLCT